MGTIVTAITTYFDKPFGEPFKNSDLVSAARTNKVESKSKDMLGLLTSMLN